MRRWPFLLVVGLSVQCAACHAQPASTLPVPTAPQLWGLESDEAAALIIKLELAQHRLRAGEFQSFELLAGSIASLEMTRLPPRDAFLEVPFAEVWNIERVRTDNRLWQPYKLSYSPNGLGQLSWDIEVVLDSDGNIKRVMMIYKPPAPF